MIEEQCSTCKYSRIGPTEKLECHARRPKQSGEYRAYWPVVLDIDWCAKWEWDGKCDHAETVTKDIAMVGVITLCKRCGSRT